MEKEFQKSAGISLLLGSFLLIVTMVLHPVGGSIEQILQIKPILIGSHSLAILSMPILAFGFWGLAKRLDAPGRLSYISFCFICFSLFAGMIAAAINGLILPFFLSEEFVTNANPELIKAILIYGKNINAAMDYILIVGIGIAILIWSFDILRTGKFSKWISFLGIGLSLVGILASFSSFNFINLYGFRIVIIGISSWIIWVGIALTFPPTEKTN